MGVPGETLCYLIEPQRCKEGTVRLMNGINNSTGRVEACYMGEWMAVCDYRWGEKDARVVCRQLEVPTNGKTHIRHCVQ